MKSPIPSAYIRLRAAQRRAGARPYLPGPCSFVSCNSLLLIQILLEANKDPPNLIRPAQVGHGVRDGVVILHPQQGRELFLVEFFDADADARVPRSTLGYQTKSGARAPVQLRPRPYHQAAFSFRRHDAEHCTLDGFPLSEAAALAGSPAVESP